jgi:DNA-directed RNA polymerase subunit RPC12/RpoP
MGDAQRIYINKQTYYICGWCKDKQWYLINEEKPPIPCPDCGWMHKNRLRYELPTEIKLNLADY